jgi:shikimate dehydrogenase
MSVTGATKVLALLGDPVARSLSPQMQNAWIADFGLDAIYVTLRIPPSGADDAFRHIGKLELFGANVTVPYKELAARYAGSRAGIVEQIGAANTLCWTSNELIAHNTDYIATARAIEEAAPGFLRHAKKVIVVGGGGAARAMAFGVAGEDGPEIVIINRSLEKAQVIASAIAPRVKAGARAAAWADMAVEMQDGDLLINATTLGMYGVDETRWPVEALPAHAVVFDAVYIPLETPLLAAARARGLCVIDGLSMLTHQGAEAFQNWFGQRPDTQLARARLLSIIRGRA